MHKTVAKAARGLELAAFEMLKAPVLRARAERIRKIAKGMLNADRAIADLPDEQTLADGFYVWVAYLFWLDGTLQVAPAAAGELLADEVEGLRAIANARAKFYQEYAPCPRCSKMIERVGLCCEHCGYSPERKETD
jgi:hypothetical protein